MWTMAKSRYHSCQNYMYIPCIYPAKPWNCVEWVANQDIYDALY